MQSHLEALAGLPIFHGGPLISAFLENEELPEIVRTAAAKALENTTGFGASRILARAAEMDSSESQFLAEAFAITRWKTGAVPSLSLPLSRLALIAFDPDGDPEIQQEVDDLMTLLGPPRVELIRPRYREVRAALASGAFDAWHFVGHGISYADDADRWELVLEDNQTLRPEDLRNLPGFGLQRPWVFLNACTSGLADESLSGPGGWALQSIEGGAGAFVGTNWLLPGNEARHFALALYRAFLLGQPLAMAAREARLQVRKAFPESPTWLAYTVYGHPDAEADRDSRLPPAC